MKAWFFALALVGPAAAFYPDRLVSQAEQAIYSLDIPDLIQSNLAPTAERPPKPEVCRKCNEFVTHHIMHAVISHLEQVCKTTTCPHMQHKCEMAKKYPQVTLGFLLAKVAPWKQSYAFCYGSGRCPHPGPPHHPHPHPHGEGQRCPDQMCLHDGNDMSVLLNYRNQPADALAELVMTNDEPGNSTCHDCIHKMACAVMNHTIEHVKAFCAKAECPCIKRACELARIHPQITLGFLIERVRPGEWGCGYCFGDGSCHARNETMVDYDVLVKSAQLIL